MWPNPLETLDLVIFTEDILKGKLHFFGSVNFIPNASQFITHFASVNHNRKKGQTPNIKISKSYKINNAEFLKKIRKLPDNFYLVCFTRLEDVDIRSLVLAVCLKVLVLQPNHYFTKNMRYTLNSHVSWQGSQTELG